MKRTIQAMNESDVMRDYPIAGRCEGWYFRVRETSANSWQAEGIDRFGRKVTYRGNDGDRALQECVLMAEQIANGGARAD